MSKVWNPVSGRFIQKHSRVHRDLCRQGILDAEGNEIGKKMKTPVVSDVSDNDELDSDDEILDAFLAKYVKSAKVSNPIVKATPKVQSVKVKPVKAPVKVKPVKAKTVQLDEPEDQPEEDDDGALII